MKNAILASGVGLVLAIVLSSPTFAQTPSTNAKSAPVAAEPAADTPLDELIELAATPEDRMRLMLRCAGPPPLPIASAPPAKEAPQVEPAVLADAPPPSTAG
jgi:hypothetical protein